VDIRNRTELLSHTGQSQLVLNNGRKIIRREKFCTFVEGFLAVLGDASTAAFLAGIFTAKERKKIQKQI